LLFPTQKEDIECPQERERERERGENVYVRVIFVSPGISRGVNSCECPY